jgi:DNA-binding ferritin-like protein
MNISRLLTLTNQLKIYHWQTKAYSQHIAFGTTYDELSELIDNYVEIFIGKYGTIVNNNGFDIKLQNLSSKKPEQFINESCEFLINEFVKNINQQSDTDLLNIRDEILAKLNKLKYLLALK